jgi:ABC-type glycerol-3-phosphate transport system substrate-binding protein
LSNRRFLISVFVVVSMLALAACGSSGGSGGGSSDEDQISAAIKVVTSSDPAGCKKFETQAFMEQSTQTSGKEAVKSCEEHLKEAKDNPKSVAISKVKVVGTGATADVAFTGGGFNGQVTTIGLLKEGGQWKLNKVEGFAKLDTAKLAEEFETQLSGPTSTFSKKTIACVVRGVEKASRAKAEELLLSGSAEPVAKLVKSCS